jgi:hypothetical protein
MGWVVSFTPRPRLNPGNVPPGTHCTGGWVGPRAGLDAEAIGKMHKPTELCFTIIPQHHSLANPFVSYLNTVIHYHLPPSLSVTFRYNIYQYNQTVLSLIKSLSIFPNPPSTYFLPWIFLFTVSGTLKQGVRLDLWGMCSGVEFLEGCLRKLSSTWKMFPAGPHVTLQLARRCSTELSQRYYTVKCCQTSKQHGTARWRNTVSSLGK